MKGEEDREGGSAGQRLWLTWIAIGLLVGVGLLPITYIGYQYLLHPTALLRDYLLDGVLGFTVPLFIIAAVLSYKAIGRKWGRS